jgi:hypothetical protein
VVHQLLSTTPPHEPTKVVLSSEELLAAGGLKHGAMLYLINTSEAPAPSGGVTAGSAANSPFNAAALNHHLTARCQHGPRGRCVNCAGVEPGKEPTYSGHCQHGPGATCLHCSDYVKAGAAADKAIAAAGGAGSAAATAPEALAASQPAAWLCTHPSTAFCPKCLPPEAPKADAKPKYDKVPFARILAERRARCSARHDKSVTCAICAPPQQPSFLGKPDCDRHRPWPLGVCTHCAPANAILRAQEYRHCDGVSLPADLLQGFYRSWSVENRRETQRAALLLGKYIDEPAESQNPGAIRAIVAALYEPPQDALTDGVRLLADPDEHVVLTVAAAMGLAPVGWVVTTGPRPGGEKYGGKVFMSGLEVCQAAALQQKFASEDGHSRFVTVVLEQSDTIEPVAYQVSDQCQALVRDGCVLPAPEDQLMLATRKVPPSEMAPTVVYHDHPLPAGGAFMPDAFLVKVIVMTTRPEQYLFAHGDFPSLRAAPSLDAVKRALNGRRGEPYHQRLSDFNLLVALVRLGVFAGDLMARLGRELVGKQPLSRELSEDVDVSLIQHQLLDFN